MKERIRIDRKQTRPSAQIVNEEQSRVPTTELADTRSPGVHHLSGFAIAPEQIAPTATSSSAGGNALPEPLRANLENALGASVSDVRVHVGDGSASAARSLGATAFAAGRDIHFDANRYAPGTQEGDRLLAHEVAHTVQQSGEALDEEPRISRRGDAHEREAAAFADAFVSGTPAPPVRASVGAEISRDGVTMEGEKISVAAPKNRVFQPQGGFALSGKKAGQSGHAAILTTESMLSAKDALANGLFDSMIVAPVNYPEKEFDKALGGLESDAARLNIAADDHDAGGTQWLMKQDKVGAKWCKNAMMAVERQLFEVSMHTQEFNDWTRQSNLALFSYVDLDAATQMLGFNISSEKGMEMFSNQMMQAVDKSMPLAGIEGARYEKKTGEQVAKPEEDDSVTSLTLQVKESNQELQNSRIGLHQELLTARAKVLKDKKAGYEGQLAEINAIIQFWAGVGGFIDTARGGMNMLGKIEKGVEKVGEVGAYAKARYNAYRNQGDRLAGKEATRDTSYTKAGDGKNVRVEVGDLGGVTGHEVTEKEVDDGKGGKRSEIVEEAVDVSTPLGGIDFSAAAVLGGIAEWVYDDKIVELKAKIDAVEGRLEAVGHVDALATTRDRVTKVRNAITKYERLSKALVAKRESRQKEYLDLGNSMDIMAAKAAKAGQIPKSSAPAKGTEMYSQLMVVAGKVRDAVALAQMADTSFNGAEFMTFAQTLVQERSDLELAPEAKENEGTYAQTSYPLTPKELEALTKIATGHAMAQNLSKHLVKSLGPVDEKLRALLVKMRGVQPTEGKKSSLLDY